MDCQLPMKSYGISVDTRSKGRSWGGGSVPRYLATRRRTLRRGGENSRSSTQTVGCETIRLVEDKELVRSVIHETLRASGYTVIVVDHPEVARHLARGYDGQIDLLLTDVAVPEATGVRLAERLGSAFDDLKLLYSSGYTADSGVLFRGHENNHFLQKPFLPATLSKTVREVLADAVPKTTICAS